MGAIYKITNTVNGKCYVGMTTRTIARRWAEHRAMAAMGYASLLHQAIRKYGEEAFAIDALHESDCHDFLCEKEREEIKAQGAFCKEHGYNVRIDGGYGTHRRDGELSSNAKLTESAVRFIRDPKTYDLTSAELVDVIQEVFELTVTSDTLRDARNGRRWKSLNAECPPFKIPKTRTTKKKARASAETTRRRHSDPLIRAEEVARLRKISPMLKGEKVAAKLSPEQVREAFTSPLSLQKMADKFGVDRGTINHIRQRKTWRDVTEGLTRA
ncbi:MAG: GIY-YIG nuclease family protein [Alphaproteobacteria bacterium]|nr:GIY-YIG nuclease family protein [Alphaproteobacteria bacterium]